MTKKLSSSFLRKKVLVTMSITVLVIIVVFCFIPYSETIHANMVLVKNGPDFYGEALIPFGYLTKVEVGQHVRVKLDGYPNTDLSMLVTKVDSVLEQPIQHYGEQCFKILISLAENERARNNKQKIIYFSGMSGTVHIPCLKKPLTND